MRFIDIKVSVIVPVYNVEEYVVECVESICNQTLKEIEILIIDDGSNDSSIERVKKIKDSRVKIISQENGGLSSARNTGMRFARGEYIAFVDSDDYIEILTAYEEMYNIAQKDNSDIVSGNCIIYYSNENKKPMNRDMSAFSYSPMEAEDYFIKCMETQRTYAPVWLNIYNRNFLTMNNLNFKEGLFHEDEEFTPRALLKANKVSIYDENFYIYRQREGSIMNNTPNTKMGKDMINICLSLQNEITLIKNKKLKSMFKEYIANIALSQIYKYKFIEVSKEVKIMIFKNSISKSLRLRSILLNINTKMYLFVESQYRKIRRIQ